MSEDNPAPDKTTVLDSVPEGAAEYANPAAVSKRKAARESAGAAKRGDAFQVRNGQRVTPLQDGSNRFVRDTSQGTNTPLTEAAKAMRDTMAATLAPEEPDLTQGLEKMVPSLQVAHGAPKPKVEPKVQVQKPAPQKPKAEKANKTTDSEAPIEESAGDKEPAKITPEQHRDLVKARQALVYDGYSVDTLAKLGDEMILEMAEARVPRQEQIRRERLKEPTTDSQRETPAPQTPTPDKGKAETNGHATPARDIYDEVVKSRFEKYGDEEFSGLLADSLRAIGQSLSEGSNKQHRELALELALQRLETTRASLRERFPQVEDQESWEQLQSNALARLTDRDTLADIPKRVREQVWIDYGESVQDENDARALKIRTAKANGQPANSHRQLASQRRPASKQQTRDAMLHRAYEAVQNGLSQVDGQRYVRGD